MPIQPTPLETKVAKVDHDTTTVFFRHFQFILLIPLRQHKLDKIMSFPSCVWPYAHSTYVTILVLMLYLTIIPRARMGSESIVHEAEGRMGY